MSIFNKRNHPQKEKAIKVSIEYPGGATDEAAYVIPLGDKKYKLDMHPLSCFLAEDDLKNFPNYGDIIEAVSYKKKKLRFVKVVERALLKKTELLISGEFSNSDALKEILSKVESFRGHWELVMGGILVVYLPKDSDYDPEKEIIKLSENSE